MKPSALASSRSTRSLNRRQSPRIGASLLASSLALCTPFFCGRFSPQTRLAPARNAAESQPTFPPLLLCSRSDSPLSMTKRMYLPRDRTVRRTGSDGKTSNAIFSAEARVSPTKTRGRRSSSGNSPRRCTVKSTAVDASLRISRASKKVIDSLET